MSYQGKSVQSYSKSMLLHEDEPEYGSVLKLVMFIVPVMLVGLGIQLWSSGENEGALVLLFEALFVSLIFWFVFPRRYQVYEDHLRIVLGGQLAVKIGFKQITTIEVTNKTALTVNFATRITRSYVRIVKKTGLGIAITPKSNESFVENANRALVEWSKTNVELGR